VSTPVLDLAVGSGLVLDGAEWMVEQLEPQHGNVVLTRSETLRLVWREWFGPGGARQRYARSVAPAGSGQHVVVTRPGQVVALDTTILPVKVRESVFGEPVSVHLTLALDACTHSLVAFRLTMVSDSSVDVAMLLRDMMMPLPLREDWGEELDSAGERAGNPEDLAVGGGDDLEGHAVAAVLAGVERPVGSHPVDRD